MLGCYSLPETSDNCVIGTENCSCFKAPNGFPYAPYKSCNDNLTCVSGVCVNATSTGLVKQDQDASVPDTVPDTIPDTIPDTESIPDTIPESVPETDIESYDQNTGQYIKHPTHRSCAPTGDVELKWTFDGLSSNGDCQYVLTEFMTIDNSNHMFLYSANFIDVAIKPKHGKTVYFTLDCNYFSKIITLPVGTYTNVKFTALSNDSDIRSKIGNLNDTFTITTGYNKPISMAVEHP
jgi:hypothetical protein